MTQVNLILQVHLVLQTQQVDLITWNTLYTWLSGATSAHGSQRYPCSNVSENSPFIHPVYLVRLVQLYFRYTLYTWFFWCFGTPSLPRLPLVNSALFSLIYHFLADDERNLEVGTHYLFVHKCSSRCIQGQILNLYNC